MKYKVNDEICYPVPGVLFNSKENTANTKVRITHIYNDIVSDNGVIVDMIMLEQIPGKNISGKLLNSKNYFENS